MTLPISDLQVRAADERRRLHGSVTELKERVGEKLDVKRNAREFLLPGCGIVALVGLMAGFGFAGLFTRH